jgi:hypothetical protein
VCVSAKQEQEADTPTRCSTRSTDSGSAAAHCGTGTAHAMPPSPLFSQGTEPHAHGPRARGTAAARPKRATGQNLSLRPRFNCAAAIRRPPALIPIRRRNKWRGVLQRSTRFRTNLPLKTTASPHASAGAGPFYTLHATNRILLVLVVANFMEVLLNWGKSKGRSRSETERNAAAGDASP